MAIITTKVTVSEAQLPLIEDAAAEQGKSVEDFLGSALGTGQSVQGIANDRAQQAWWRLSSRGDIPQAVLDESRAYAQANAPKATEASA